jgi:hypothetical protein
MLSNRIQSGADGGRVIQFRPRMEAARRDWREAPEPDYSPVPDLAKFEHQEDYENEYRHRMIVNLVAFVFTTFLTLAGVWIALMAAHGSRL